jgi:hypothetical protein
MRIAQENRQLSGMDRLGDEERRRRCARRDIAILRQRAASNHRQS